VTPLTSAVLERVQGTVFVLAGSEKSAARSGRIFSAGEGLQTAGAGSLAALRCPDGTWIELGADTTVKDMAAAAGDTSKAGRLAVEAGTLRAQVTPRAADRPLVFTTPHADAVVLGTRLALSVKPESTRLEVREGRVLMTRRGDGSETEVESGQFAVAAAGTPLKPGSLVRLLAFQDGVSPAEKYAGTRDTTLSRNVEFPEGLGAQKTCRVTGPNPRGTHRDAAALIRWDLTAIPPGSTVVSVVLTVDVQGKAARQPFQVFELKRPWEEHEATWATASAQLAWERRGAQGPTDRAAPAIGSAPFPVSEGPLAIPLSPQGVSAVQGWVNRPAANFGFLLANEVTPDGVVFSSREAETAGRRPKLVVSFIPPDGP
jgi:hypothetical protein